MNELHIFSIFDAKASAFLQPFFSRNADTAKREFTAAINGTGSFNQFSEDYSLFILGSFNQEDGTFTLLQAPEPLCAGVQVREQPEPPMFPMTNGMVQWPTGPQPQQQTVETTPKPHNSGAK